ncbi:MAG: hypothetical protein KDC38_01425, partial [Planctomycetes bacterium]|nr:hypothetical protein [Planctomycetota bacterium]
AIAVGDCSADGTTDVGDAIALATYLFEGGAAPACLRTCDANGDGAADLGDVVYLLQHLFGSGATPVAAAACSSCDL